MKLRLVLIVLRCLESLLRTKGTMLEITSVNHTDIIDGSAYGVDLTNCSSLTFSVKSCDAAYLLLGDASLAGSYEIVIGGWENTASALRHCGDCTIVTQVSTVGVLGCDSFRDFWVSWEDSRLALGEGRVLQERVIFDEPSPELHEIYTVGFMGFTGEPATFILGLPCRTKISLEVGAKKYTDGIMSDSLTDLPSCIRRCHDTEHCGMFSYNSGLGRCLTFNRITSSFSMTSEAGWKSWRITYC